jgi:hypothetical protein
MQFLELIVEKPEKIFNDYIIREENRKLGKAPIGYYFQNSSINNDEFIDMIEENCKKHSSKNSFKNDEKKVVKKTVKKVVKRIIKTSKQIEEDKIANIEKKNKSIKTVSDDKLIDLFKL